MNSINKYFCYQVQKIKLFFLQAAKLALDYGWSMNLGGGFHHCSADAGGGFCVYADISGALKTLKYQNLINTALIIDLDAHQVGFNFCYCVIVCRCSC